MCRRRLQAGLDMEIQHYQQCRALLSGVTPDIYKNGRELFSSDRALAIWLCSPARALGGQLPVSVLDSEEGRTRVAHILGAIGHGVFL